MQGCKVAARAPQKCNFGPPWEGLSCKVARLQGCKWDTPPRKCNFGALPRGLSCKVARLQGCNSSPPPRGPSCKVARLQGCKVARLQLGPKKCNFGARPRGLSCKVARLQSWGSFCDVVLRPPSAYNRVLAHFGASPCVPPQPTSAFWFVSVFRGVSPSSPRVVVTISPFLLNQKEIVTESTEYKIQVGVSWGMVSLNFFPWGISGNVFWPAPQSTPGGLGLHTLHTRPRLSLLLCILVILRGFWSY